KMSLATGNKAAAAVEASAGINSDVASIGINLADGSRGIQIHEPQVAVGTCSDGVREAGARRQGEFGDESASGDLTNGVSEVVGVPQVPVRAGSDASKTLASWREESRGHQEIRFLPGRRELVDDRESVIRHPQIAVAAGGDAERA